VRSNWSRATNDATFQWIDDRLLSEQVELMARGPEDARFTPSLIFCFNRDQCWNVAEQLKGKSMLSDGQKERLAARMKRYDMSQGAGPKLRQLLMRGVGVHHAGVLAKYRRIVEDLFQHKLLSATVGNARQFVQWLRIAHRREVELVESNERRVPLTFQWIDIPAASCSSWLTKTT